MKVHEAVSWLLVFSLVVHYLLQTSHNVKFGFQVKFDLEGQDQSIPKNNRDLGCFASFVRISDNSSLNGWWVMSPTSPVLTHTRTHTHTCACNGNTRRLTLSSDRNYCICYNIYTYKVFDTESKISACRCHGNNYARISVLMKPPWKNDILDVQYWIIWYSTGLTLSAKANIPIHF